MRPDLLKPGQNWHLRFCAIKNHPLSKILSQVYIMIYFTVTPDDHQVRQGVPRSNFELSNKAQYEHRKI